MLDFDENRHCNFFIRHAIIDIKNALRVDSRKAFITKIQFIVYNSNIIAIYLPTDKANITEAFSI